MHFKISLTAFAVICGISSYACDVCGCSAGSAISGWYSFQNVNSLGVLASQQRFQSTHPTLFENEIPIISRDDFQTVDVHFRLFPFKHLMISGQIPVNRSSQTEVKEQTSTNGLGDPVIYAHLVLTNRSDSSAALLHRLLIGGGIKLPLGKSTIADGEDEIINANLQPGTGSFDFPISVSYMLKRERWGASTDVSYRINSANAAYYRFGNRLNVNMIIMRWMKLKSEYWLRPHAGISWQHSDWDISDTRIHRVNLYSKGSFLFSDVGASFQAKQFVFASSFKLPLGQNFAQRNVRVNHLFQIEINYLFKTKKQ